MKQAGPALGYGQYAAAITKNASGHYEVAIPRCAAKSSSCATIRPRTRSWPAPSPRPMRRCCRNARARAERRRTLHRAFSRRRRCGALDLGRRQRPRCQRRRAIFPMPRRPIRRSSTIARPARRAASHKCAIFSPRATMWRRGRGRACPRLPLRKPQPRRAPGLPRQPSSLPILRPPIVSRRMSCALFRSIGHLPRCRECSGSGGGRRCGSRHRRHDQRLRRCRSDPWQQENEIFHGLFQDPGRTGPVAAVVSQLWGVSVASGQWLPAAPSCRDDVRSVQ